MYTKIGLEAKVALPDSVIAQEGQQTSVEYVILNIIKNLHTHDFHQFP